MEAIFVIGLGFGDEGKGKIVDALTRHHKAGMNVRFSGGCQAAHNVVTDDGIHHTFSQLGSGSFVPEVKTFLGSEFLLDPLALVNEANSFNALTNSDVYGRVYVSSMAPIVTSFHQAMGRIRELVRGEGRNGSTGKGIGETQLFRIRNPGPHLRMDNLKNGPQLKFHLERIRDTLHVEAVKLVAASNLDYTDTELAANLAKYLRWFKWDIDNLVSRYLALVEKITIVEPKDFAQFFAKEQTIIFEGSQGIGLDERHGFAPYNTWANLMPDEVCQNLLIYNPNVQIIGVTRAYTTRHGAGPFPTEDMALTDAFPDPHNPTNEFQENMRNGHLDVALLRYTIACLKKVDALAVTHFDTLQTQKIWKICYGYEVDGKTFVPQPNDDFFDTSSVKITFAQMKQTERMSLADCRYMDVASEHVLDMIEFGTGIPIKIVGTGPKSSDIIIK